MGGRIAGAVFVFGADLPERVDELRDAGTPAVVCVGGFRSTVPASLLRARGITGVHNVVGGVGAWSAAGHPTAATTPAAAR